MARPIPTPTRPVVAAPVRIASKPIIAVKVENTTMAYPRVGHGSADVVYVEPVEGGLTRLLAIFVSRKPSTVGPIRSAREVDATLLAAYGPKVPLVFSGASRYTHKILSKGTQHNIYAEASMKGFARAKGRVLPHNLMGALPTLLARSGKPVIPKDPGLHFGAALPGGKSARTLSASWAACRITATWSAKAKGYTLTTDGRREIDALTKKSVVPRTVIVQHVVTKNSRNRDVLGNPTPIETVTGSGKATFFRDGKVWRGTWTRRNAASPTVYRVGSKEFLLAPGQVWIMLLPTSAPLTVR